MAWSPAELEQVVRQVLAQLAASSGGQPSGSVPASAASGSTVSVKSANVMVPVVPSLDSSSPKTRRLMQQIISTDTLRHQLEGIAVLEVRSQAIVTPSALDILRDRGVRLVRLGNKVDGSEPSGIVPSAEPAPVAIASTSEGVVSTSGEVILTQRKSPILVVGDVDWLGGLAKRLCPQRTEADSEPSDARVAISRIVATLTQPKRVAVLITRYSFEATHLLQKHDHLRAARLGQWNDLQSVLTSWKPNVLVLDSQYWNVPSSYNAVNRFYDSGIWRSQRMGA